MDETRKLFWVQAFHAMAQVWEWFQPTADRIRVWDGALADLSVEELRVGVAKVLANHSGSQPPTPGEVRDWARGKLSWETVRHHIDGKVMGRREVRARTPESIAPAPLGVLDPDRGAPRLPRELTRELEERTRPN